MPIFIAEMLQYSPSLISFEWLHLLLSQRVFIISSCSTSQRNPRPVIGTSHYYFDRSDTISE